jgi:hypothetical protein
MKEVTKTTALFFAAVLFFLSTSTENYSLLLTSKLQNTASENSGSYLSTGNPDLFFLNRHEERLVTSVKNLPVTNLRNYINNFNNNSLSPEIRLSGNGSVYLLYSESVYLNLTNINIIFPFHYFW